MTNLYKAAAGEADKAYSEGYQHALEDLLGFLDRENLGLQDGEGWRVRQFVTERWDGGGGDREGGESDEEREEERRASSPEGKRKGSPAPVSASSTSSSSSTSQGRAESAPPVAPASEATSAQRNTTSIPASPQVQSYTVPSGDFTFQSSHQYPRDMETDDNGTVHINVLPHAPHRSSRVSSRSQNIDRRQQQLARNSSSLGHGAGMKRRVGTAFDFFDLGGFGGKDPFGGSGAGGGGGKRGRFT